MTFRNLVFGNPGGSTPGADFGLLILRWVAGLSLAFAHGMAKLPPSAGFMSGVRHMGFPLPEVFAWAATFSEFLGGVLVALGLLTRPAALFALFTMGTAFFVRHQADAFDVKEKALLYGAAMLTILFTGPGRFSLDKYIGAGSR
jgi:putative oxidoreductase